MLGIYGKKQRFKVKTAHALTNPTLGLGLGFWWDGDLVPGTTAGLVYTSYFSFLLFCYDSILLSISTPFVTDTYSLQGAFILKRVPVNRVYKEGLMLYTRRPRVVCIWIYLFCTLRQYSVDTRRVWKYVEVWWAKALFFPIRRRIKKKKKRRCRSDVHRIHPSIVARCTT